MIVRHNSLIGKIELNITVWKTSTRQLLSVSYIMYSEILFGLIDLFGNRNINSP